MTFDEYWSSAWQENNQPKALNNAFREIAEKSWQAALQQPAQVAEPFGYVVERNHNISRQYRYEFCLPDEISGVYKDTAIAIHKVYAAPIAAVPEGYVIVPVVPTYAMLDEGGRRLQENIPAKSELEFQADAHTAWDGMLAAAPKQGD